MAQADPRPTGGGPRADLAAIVERGVQAVQPRNCLSRWIELEGGRIRVAGDDFTPDPGGRLVVLSLGKASAGMVEATLRALPGRVDDLLVAAPAPAPADLVLPAASRWFVGGHPVPDAGSRSAASALRESIRRCTPADRVLVLLSGGASALVSEPVEGISPEEKAEIHRALVESGATIDEINTVRKHLSLIKGGRMAQACSAGAMRVLLISDVVGDRLDSIASGPFAPDPTTFAEARRVLEERGLWEGLPGSARQHVEAGCTGGIPETPAPGAPCFEHVRHHIVASNATALAASRREAEDRGYRCEELPDAAAGSNPQLAARFEQAVKTRAPGEAATCLLSGGESTVEVRGEGLGGRCQDLALRLALGIEGRAGVNWLVAGTDGRDGPGHAAGAFADGGTVARAVRAGLDPRSFLERSDSTRFFEALGDLYVTGPTGTNVMDLRVALLDGATAWTDGT